MRDFLKSDQHKKQKNTSFFTQPASQIKNMYRFMLLIDYLFSSLTCAIELVSMVYAYEEAIQYYF